MNEKLTVNPDDLQNASARLGLAAADLRVSHESAHSTLSEVLTSFGASATAAAIAARLAFWESETNAHCSHLLDHSANHEAAAGTYMRSDAERGAQIAAAGNNFE
jgi:hypothetical protein